MTRRWPRAGGEQFEFGRDGALAPHEPPCQRPMRAGLPVAQRGKNGLNGGGRGGFQKTEERAIQQRLAVSESPGKAAAGSRVGKHKRQMFRSGVNDQDSLAELSKAVSANERAAFVARRR